MSKVSWYSGQEAISAIGIILIIFVPVIGAGLEATGWVSRLLAALALFALAFGFGWLVEHVRQTERIRQLEMQIEAYEHQRTGVLYRPE